MGRGNFCYDEGFVVYVEPDEDCEYFADDLFDNLMYDLNKKNKTYYPTKEYDVYKNIAYHLENDFVKIGVADNETRIAICFTPRETEDGEFDRRANPCIRRAIRTLMKYYPLYGRAGAWTSFKVSSPEEII